MNNPGAKVALLTALTACIAPTAAWAADPEPAWQCGASAAYVETPDGRTAPADAGNPNGNCTDDEFTSERTTVNRPVRIDVGGPLTLTEVDPDAAPTQLMTISAEAGLQRAQIIVGDTEVATALVRSRAYAYCAAGRPVLQGESTVLGLRVAGQERSFTDRIEQVFAGPGNTVVRVVGNDQVVSGDDASPTQSLVQRALRVEIEKDGRFQGRVVVGESRVARTGATCGEREDVPEGGSFANCPEGTDLDVARRLCLKQIVVREGGPCPADSVRDASGACVRTVVVRSAGGRPGGGLLLPFADLPRSTKVSPCRNGRFGRRAGVVGTNRSDRITGSNVSDRIFVLRGNDKVAAGRGNDCVDGFTGTDKLHGGSGSDYLIGGSGNDRLDGGQLHDRLYGGPGDDVLVGSSGNDRIFGGPGDDAINAGYGIDRIDAGSGDDVINAATDTRFRQRVRCGPGRDLVRAQRKDIVARDCELVYRSK